MADDQANTTFIQRASTKLNKHRTLAASGTGLSAAALIYIHSIFATRSDLEKMRQAQTTQWQRISQLHDELNQVKAQNSAYEMLLRYVSTGQIYYHSAHTNQ